MIPPVRRRVTNRLLRVGQIQPSRPSSSVGSRGFFRKVEICSELRAACCLLTGPNGSHEASSMGWSLNCLTGSSRWPAGLRS